jgi:hypothetical protein
MAALSVFLAALFGFIVGIVFLGVAYSKFAWTSKQEPISLSWANVQLITWTGVVLGSYVAFALLKGGFPDSIPDNLLLLMGVSVGAQSGSKLTRVLQEEAKKKKEEKKKPPAQAAGRAPKAGGPATPAGIQGLMAKESNPDELSVAKLQHLAWTLVAVFVYLIAVWTALNSRATSLPDVGSGLPALMGISASGYIANKIGDSPQVET